jgi:hypothetical protein
MRMSADELSKRQKVRYVKMRMGGRCCVIDARDVADMTKDEEPGSFTLEDIWYSPTEVENMAEFTGW